MWRISLEVIEVLAMTTLDKGVGGCGHPLDEAQEVSSQKKAGVPPAP